MRRAGSPLRGRAVECEVLRSGVLAAARDGCGSVTVVRGAAGSGKSRLLHEAADLARDSGLRLLSVSGDPDARVIPHGPLLDAVQAGPEPLMGASDLEHLPWGPEQGSEAVRAGSLVFVVEIDRGAVLPPRRSGVP